MKKVNPTNIFICKLLLDPNNKYKLNFNEGDTLKINIKKLWGLDSFDAVIGNPPYNKNLYKKFTQYCLLKTNNILLFVIPSTFIIGVSSEKFRILLKENGLKLIKYLDKKIWNIKIDIDTLYLLCIKKYKDKILINDIKIERTDRLLNITCNIHYNLLKKIEKIKKLELLKGKNKTLNYTNKIENDNIKFIENDIYCHKLLSRLNGGKGDEIYYMKNYNENYIEGVKLIFARGTASYNSLSNLKNLSKDIVYSKITDEKIFLSTGLVYLLCNNIEEAKFLQWYLMKSKFIRYLFIKENKYSELTKGFVNLIPYIDYKQINNNFTDINIYNFLKLDKEEINIIENEFIKITFQEKVNQITF